MQLCAEVFKRTEKQMTPEEIWDYALENGLDQETSVAGKTPWRTLGAQMYTDIDRKGESSKFRIVSKRPTRFFLNSGGNADIPEVEVIRSEIKEKDLHQFLTSFIMYDPHFSCYSKTINANTAKSKAKNQNHWLYPDVVGIQYQFDTDSEAYNLFENLKQNSVKIYSFELKTSLSLSDVRQYYFQAISNSSWAHEGYIVALEVSGDAIEELRSLNRSFGIGVIKLNLNDVAQSEIIFPSKVRDNLDEEMVLRLIKNGDFKELISRMNKDIKACEVNKIGYDIVKDEEALHMEAQRLKKK